MSYKQLEGVWTVNVSVLDAVDVGLQLGEECFGVDCGGLVERESIDAVVFVPMDWSRTLVLGPKAPAELSNMRFLLLVQGSAILFVGRIAQHKRCRS